MKLPVDYTKIDYKERRLVREEYIKIQDGNCHYCKEPLSGKPSKVVRAKTVNIKLFPKGFFNYPLHLHHCHKTAMTIGTVHCYCNAVLWQYHGE
jgi:hypothetical protein